MQKLPTVTDLGYPRVRYHCGRRRFHQRMYLLRRLESSPPISRTIAAVLFSTGGSSKISATCNSGTPPCSALLDSARPSDSVERSKKYGSTLPPAQTARSRTPRVSSGEPTRALGLCRDPPETIRLTPVLEVSGESPRAVPATISHGNERAWA
jgi:hypothetical protein